MAFAEKRNIIYDKRKFVVTVFVKLGLFMAFAEKRNIIYDKRKFVVTVFVKFEFYCNQYYHGVLMSQNAVINRIMNCTFLEVSILI